MVVLNYFGQEDVVACLRSLDKNLQVSADVVVWNNGGPAELIQNHIDQHAAGRLNYFLLPSDRNLGFAPAVNRAAEWKRERGYEALLLLNSDATLLSIWNEAVQAQLLKLQGIAGVKVYNDENKNVRQKSARSFPSLLTSFTNRQSLFAKVFPNNPWTRRYLNTDLKDSEVQRVDWVSGCGLFCPREIWEKLGGFDESYFFGVEDVDLGRSAQKNKVPVYYFPGVEILHVGGVAAGRASLRSDFYHHLGMWNYYIKWARPLGFLLGPLVFLGITARFLLRRFYQVRTRF